MVRVREVLGLALISGALTIVLGAAQARDVKIQKPAQVAVVAATEKAEVGQAAAEKIVEVPACARKVKIVYAGYGEAGRAGCLQ